jgi:UDP-N-acetylmuramate--alanine ligase
VRAVNIAMGAGGADFDVVITPLNAEPTTLADVHLPMAGEHNVTNALAAIAVARELGVSEAAIREGLTGFAGVRRRFTVTGEAGGVRVIDDYGHHPVEIAAALRSARAVTNGRVIAVVQPHRYSRLSSLFEEFCACFNDADAVIVADVYPAGEAPIEGANRDGLVEGLRRWGHRRVLALDGPDALAALVAEEAKPGDLVVLLGAGDITSWAYALPAGLAALQGQ